MTLYGYDISSWQAGLDPAAVPGDFVIVKATGGKSYLNPYCNQHVQAAKAAGKRVMVYHYAHEAGCQGTAAEEAQWFLENTRGYQDGTVGFCLDWESDNVWDSAYALEFKLIFEAGADVRLWGYGSVSQLDALKPCHDQDSPLWVAAYSLGYQPISGYSPPVGPIGVPSWANVSMWQFTSQGYLPGYGGPLDLNVFYGDEAAWDALCAKLTNTPQEEPMPTPQEIALAVWSYKNPGIEPDRDAYQVLRDAADRAAVRDAVGKAVADIVAAIKAAPPMDAGKAADAAYQAFLAKLGTLKLSAS